MTVRPINQRYNASVVLDGSGNGSVSITMRADFVLQRTRWLVQGGTGTNQATAENYIDDQPFEGSQSGNNDQSNSGRLLTPQNVVTCHWTGGPPGGAASLFLWGVEYPAGQGIPPPAAGGGPGNPILGGTTLIRDAIQSANYVPGVSGWAIFRDGSLEMNDGTFRGEVDVVGTDGSKVTIATTSGGVAEIDLYPHPYSDPTVTNNPAVLTASEIGSGGFENAILTVESPYPSNSGGSAARAFMNLISSTLNLSTTSKIQLFANSIELNGVLTAQFLALNQPYFLATLANPAGGVLNNTVTNLAVATVLTNQQSMGAAASIDITIPVGYNGDYEVQINLNFATNVTGIRQARIVVNGASYFAFSTGALTGFNTQANVNITVPGLIAGDKLNVGAFQNSGGALAINGTDTVAVRKVLN